MAAILYGILSWLLQKVVLQAILYALLYVFVTAAVGYLQQFLFTGDNGINADLNSITGSITIFGQTINAVPMTFFFLNYFMIPQWLETVLIAYATVFLIRRIPFIG